MKKTILLLGLFFGMFSCETTEPPPPPPPYVRSIELAAEEVSCTEAWLRVQITDGSSPPFDVALRSDDQTVQTFRLSTTDSLLIDEGLNGAGLLPNRAYTYKAYRLSDSQTIDSSTLATVTTMDTTSHNWTFVVDTIGGTGSSLRDVCLFADGTAWAVGEVTGVDTTGPFPNAPVGAMFWNGMQWQPRRIITTFGSQLSNVAPIRGVFAFSSNDIWFAAGSVVHWNGIAYMGYALRQTILSGNETVEKLWGTSSNNLFGVGNEGTIVHFNGSTWQKMPSPTVVDLLDVWGSPDGSVVWACGYHSDQQGTYLLRYQNGIWEMVYDGTLFRTAIRTDSLSGAYASVRAFNARQVFVGTSAGLYRAPMSTRGEAKRYSFTPGFFPGFPRQLRGNDLNDLFLVGEYYMISHFNGITFKYFPDIYGIGRLWSVDQKGNAVFAVGVIIDAIDRKGIVFRGIR